MSQEELQRKLEELVAGWENEVVEFKEENDGYPTKEIGKYFSALSNEANLRSKHRAWLVLGVNNKSRTITGSNYRRDPVRLQELKLDISNGTSPRISFREIHVLQTSQGRVVMFEIPAAPQGMPIAWNLYCHARENTSLVGLSDSKRDEIRGQTGSSDWSAAIVPNASILDLDEKAIQLAREKFAERAPRIGSEAIMGWSTTHFLDQAMVTIEGHITRTTLLLLGKHTAAHHLGPAPAELTWKLEGPEWAYEHFAPPFILSTSLLYQRIRNLTLKFLPPGQLIPKEIPKYDQGIVLEALHNCIAHQDYARNERVLVTERVGELEFRSAGHFYDGSPEDYLLTSRTPGKYRNAFLARAMSHLGMVDRMGFGIREVMFQGQAKAFRPLPFYDPDPGDHVVLHLPGQIIDENYSRLLLTNPDLKLADIIALDRVQKGMAIPDETAKLLKRRKLIEGRKPNYHVAAKLANTADQKAAYIHNRKFDSQYYRKLVIEYLHEFGHANKRDLRTLLWKQLPGILDDAAKENKLRNLLTSLRSSGLIHNVGSKNTPRWELIAFANHDPEQTT